MYTMSVQEMDRTFRDKGEKYGKEVGTRANKDTYLKQVHTNQTNKRTCTQTNMTQTYNTHVTSTKYIIDT